MIKIPKLMLVVAMSLLISVNSCHKNDVDPNQLEFLCKEAEKTIQTYANQEGVIKKIEYRQENPKQPDLTKEGYLIRSFIYVIQIFDIKKSIFILLIPNKIIDKKYQIDELKIEFNGDLKNCEFINAIDPHLDIIVPLDYTTSNKIILKNIKNI
jgi:hypothetical protein